MKKTASPLDTLHKTAENSTDIADHRNPAGKQFAESEKKFQLLAEAAADALFEIRSDGLFTAVSPGAEALFGYSAAELLKKPAVKFFPEEKRAELAELMQTILSGETVKNAELVFRKKDGSPVYLEFTALPIFVDGNAAGLLCAARDITNRKIAETALAENEKKFRLLLENSPNAIFELDLNGVHQYVSPATTEIFGYTVEETIGAHFAQYLPEEKIPEAFEIFNKILSGERVLSYVSEAVRKDGKKIFADFCIAPIMKDGEVIGIQGITRDITAQKQAEMALAESRETLRQLTKHLHSAREDERAAIARELHDELGQVLTAINMEASWINGKLAGTSPLKPQAESVATLARGAIRSVKRIISELRPTLLNDLGLPAAIKWQTQEYQNHIGIRFQVAIEPEEIDVGEELGIAVFRIFQEATTNIIRHAGATTAWVSLKKKDGKIELVVKDNGIGFSGESSPVEKSFGILGMRERAEMLGGDLGISSRPGKGTTVCVRLPF